MSKKEEAFALFSQGKAIKDPEVEVLGLAPRTNAKYYRLWKQLNPEPAVATSTSPIGVLSEMLVTDVANGGLFEHKGQLYKKKLTIYSGQVIANLMAKAHYTDVLKEEQEPVEFKPDVLVTPKL